MMRPDAARVADVRAGDVTAFADLYRLHVGAVRRVVADQIRDSESIADVVQDTFARALEHLDSLRDAERFRPWLLSIARHTATDHLRSGSRIRALDQEQAEAIEATGPGPESLAELRELADQVQGCVAGLSRRDATAVAMVTHLGFSPVQVAAALGLTPGAAKVVVHRARRRLRHALTLQLLVRQPGLACEDFRLLLPQDSLAAAKHLDDCEICIEAAATEVIPFQAIVAVPPPQPH
jgi:RNA polymerase sigma factor (sigma-70 family)